MDWKEIMFLCMSIVLTAIVLVQIISSCCSLGCPNFQTFQSDAKDDSFDLQTPYVSHPPSSVLLRAGSRVYPYFKTFRQNTELRTDLACLRV